ncbi:MAG: hypothetical protein HQ513_18845 [Rhodospirillales bacterium]|nr:hypothetical protein [Rhodospirillales bacterium]
MEVKQENQEPSKEKPYLDESYTLLKRTCYFMAALCFGFAGFAFTYSGDDEISGFFSMVGRIGFFIWMPLLVSGYVFRVKASGDKVAFWLWAILIVLWSGAVIGIVAT